MKTSTEKTTAGGITPKNKASSLLKTKASAGSVPKEEIVKEFRGQLDGVENRLVERAKNIENSFDNLERRMEKLSAFMYWAIGTVIAVLLVTFMVLLADYFHYGEERYEKFVDKIQEVRDDYYSKEDMDNILEESHEQIKSVETTLADLKEKNSYLK